MNKLIAVFKREYITTVRTKMFIIMTFLLPVFMAVMMVLPSMLMMRGMGEKRVAVLDGTGALGDTFSDGQAPAGKTATTLPSRNRALQQIALNMQYIDRKGDRNLDETAKPFLARLSSGDKNERIDGVFIIPSDALTNGDAHLKYYSRSATDFISQERLSSMTNRAIQRNRLEAKGITAEDVDRVMKPMSVDSVQLSKSGVEKKGGAANFLVGFLLTALLVIPSFVYGTQIMRGIIQEKTDRVVEILVSSMSPTQLLVGKIIGVAAAGLTQIAVWIVMAIAVGTFGVATAAMAGENVLQMLRPATFVYFAIFFALAYLTYVCVYAIGGAVCNSEKEAQQLIMPITMVMMLPWFLLAGIITNPDSNLSVGFSLAPVFGPMTMYVRTLVADPPMWHIAVSIAVSIVTIVAFFWATAKIFRIGILSYGKRPTIPELWRWMKVA